jgi:hypothetical protein
MKDVLLNTIFNDIMDKRMTVRKVLKLIQSKKLFDTGKLAEQGISIKSGVGLCETNTQNIDLVSGKQIKHGTTNPTNDGYRKASIGTDTTADILAVITETLTGDQYFLYIPYSAHKKLKGSIAIRFELDGTPCKSKWWKYQVESFEKLCKLAK